MNFFVRALVKGFCQGLDRRNITGPRATNSGQPNLEARDHQLDYTGPRAHEVRATKSESAGPPSNVEEI